MLGRLLRVLVGFLVACFGAGLTMVLFVLTPTELAGLPPDVASDRVGKASELAAFVGVQTALFSAPFALVVAAVGEALRNRNWTFYTLAGVIIAGLGFLAQHSTEQPGQPTIVNNYALTAFITAGFVGGLLYWLFSGRSAGGRNGDPLRPATSLAASSTGAAPAKPAQPPASKGKPVETAKSGAAATGAAATKA